MAAELDTSKAEDGVWLVKVPSAVAKAWRAVMSSAPEGGGGVLGTLTKRQHGDEAISYVELDGLPSPDGGSLPKRLRIQPVAPLPGDISKTCIFSYSTAAEGQAKPVTVARVDGTVAERVDLLPVSQAPDGVWVVDEEYRSRINRRTAQAAERARTVQPHEDSAEASLAAISRRRGAAALAEQRRKAMVASAKAVEAKKSKMERPALEALLFRLFEQQAAWPFRQLLAETLQPVQHLREVLDGIAEQSRRGPNKDKYELRREYRTGGAAAAAAAAPGGAGGHAGGT